MNEFSQIFNKGILNSTVSFSQLFSDEIAIEILHEGMHPLEDEDSLGIPSLLQKEEISVYSMKIHGEVDGRCYLLFNKEEFEIFCQIAYGKSVVMHDVKEEFVKEFTNILGWAVLSIVTNNLKIKVFAETPELAKLPRFNLRGTIFDDFSEFTEEVFVHMGSFKMKGNSTFRPLFIWVLDGEAVQEIQNKIAVKAEN